MQRIIFLLFSAVALIVSAQTTDPQMLVNPTSGQSTAFPLSTLRTITFEGAYVVVTNQSGETTSFAINAVRSLTFDDLPEYSEPEIVIPAATENVKQTILFARQGNNLVVSGLIDGARIYSVSGQLLSSAQASEGIAVLPLTGFSRGTYVVIADDQPYKIFY